MFHLFSHCCSWLQAMQEPVRKVTLLVMGLDNAGKTSVIADMERGEERRRAGPDGAAALRSCGSKGPNSRAPGPLRAQGPACPGSAGVGAGMWRGRGAQARGRSRLPVPAPRSPHAALPGEALPGAQPGQSRLRLDRFEVTLRDLPGAQRSRSAWRSHYSEAHGLLFVLDSADLARMEEARKVLGRVLSHPDASGKPLLLLANKQDAPAALLPCELIERLCLERLVNEHRSPCRIRSPRRSPLSRSPQEPCVAKRVPPAGPARTTLQGLRWLLRAAAAAPVPPAAPRAARGRPPARRHRPLPGEENGEPRAVRPGCRLLPLEESAKGPRRRKRKVKVKKKGLGQAGPAEEPEGPGAGAAGGLLLPNRVGQEEPSAVGTGTPHPAQSMKKKKKKKIKNKIKSREPSLEQQREEVSSTFDLYRRAMLALKMRQQQRKQPSAIAP
ncbi:ADP-ribosylation factor-like protein 13A [Melospiza georgiana]|uniref:ADP-ribosylation factor-like protein 13A n=1 Tax=Melospiza georgiana TaxID=44398 RepID=UPI0025AB844E|nr:ADP-ribosylation factor-like protein 13A [Melospiza georgiana]